MCAAQIPPGSRVRSRREGATASVVSVFSAGRISGANHRFSPVPGFNGYSGNRFLRVARAAGDPFASDSPRGRARCDAAWSHPARGTPPARGSPVRRSVRRNIQHSREHVGRDRRRGDPPPEGRRAGQVEVVFEGAVSNTTTSPRCTASRSSGYSRRYDQLLRAGDRTGLGGQVATPSGRVPTAGSTTEPLPDRTQHRDHRDTGSQPLHQAVAKRNQCGARRARGATGRAERHQAPPHP